MARVAEQYEANGEINDEVLAYLRGDDDVDVENDVQRDGPGDSEPPHVIGEFADDHGYVDVDGVQRPGRPAAGERFKMNGKIYEYEDGELYEVFPTYVVRVRKTWWDKVKERM
jgi:hypothetical protein